jgi:hypothetical protein
MSVRQFDADGNPDVSAFVAAGYAKEVQSKEVICASREYLFPIPTKEILICSRLKAEPWILIEYIIM